MLEIDFEKILSLNVPTQEMIDDVVVECFNPLPQSYVDFLKKNNGGFPVQKYGKVAGQGFVIEAFLPLLNDEEGASEIRTYDLIQTYHDIFERLDSYSVPFTLLFAGDIICFSYENCDIPKIVRWHHELSTEGKPHLTHIANNFEEFILNLRREPY